MEVSLLDVKGLPKGCLVSVRSGTHRCQAPADPDKMKLFFPKGAKESFKVDLLAPLGSAEIKHQAGANAYPIQVPINGEIGKLTLGIREMEKPSKLDLNAITTMEYTKEDKGRPASPSTASRRHRLALQARAYLDDHKLLVFVQSLLQGLIRDKPVDPWEYINESSNTAKKLGVTEPHKPGLTPRDPGGFAPPSRESVPCFLQMPGPTGLTWGEYVAPLRPELNDEDKLTGPWFELMQAAVSFEHSTPDWAAQAEFAEAGMGPAAMVIDFSERCGYGELREPLVVAESMLRAQYEAVDACRVTPGHSLASPDYARPVTSVISQAITAQSEATSVGAQPFMHRPSVATWLARPSPLATKAPPPVDAQADLRMVTLRALDEASQDGSIDKLASQMNAMQKLRQEASKRLLEAAANGSLLKALPEAAACGMSIEEIQKKAREALLKASEGGQLGQILSAQLRQQKAATGPTLSPELSDLRNDMKKLLVKAAEDGSFEKALEDLRPSNDEAVPTLPWHPLQWRIRPSTPTNLIATPQDADIDQVRASAREVLLEASQSGLLQKSLESAKPVGPAKQPDQKAEANVDEVRGMTRSLLLKAGQDGSLLQALKGGAQPIVEDEATKMRRMVQEMLQQAGQDARLLSALHEAADAAGFELKLRPKPKALPGSTNEELRAQARSELVEASLDGRFAQALDEAANEEGTRSDELREEVRTKLEDALQSGGLAEALNSSTEEDGICEGDEVVDRRTTRRFTVTKRTATEVLLKPQDGSGTECWKSARAVDKVPKLNLAALNLQQREEVDDGPRTPRLRAPANYAAVGEEVQQAGNPRKRGIVRKRTTTDICVQMEDGSETWHDVEDLEQAIEPARDVTEGQQIVSARNGRKGVVKTRTQAEVLVLHDDGSEEWLNVENVGRVQSKPSQDDVEAAKANAREALSAALFGPQDGKEEELAQALRCRSESDIANSKKNARDALHLALLGNDNAEEAPVPLLPFGKYYSKHVASGALIVEDMARKLFQRPKEPRSPPPAESQKRAEAASSASAEDLARALNTRNDRFAAENDALKQENRRLQAILKKRAASGNVGLDAS